MSTHSFSACCDHDMLEAIPVPSTVGIYNTGAHQDDYDIDIRRRNGQISHAVHDEYGLPQDAVGDTITHAGDWASTAETSRRMEPEMWEDFVDYGEGDDAVDSFTLPGSSAQGYRTLVSAGIPDDQPVEYPADTPSPPGLTQSVTSSEDSRGSTPDCPNPTGRRYSPRLQGKLPANGEVAIADSNVLALPETPTKSGRVRCELDGTVDRTTSYCEECFRVLKDGSRERPSFSRQSDLRRHLAAKHKAPGRKEYMCYLEPCPYSSSRRDHCKQHWDNKHRDVHGDFDYDNLIQLTPNALR